MATLLPNGEQTFLDTNGNPLEAGSVYMYVPGTTTLKDTWQDPDSITLNTNPIILDQAGRAVIYGTGAYRQVVYDSAGNLIWDQLTADTAVGGIAFGGTSTGTPNAQAIAASSFNEEDGQQVTFFVGPGLTNTGAVTISLGGGSPIALLKDTTSGPTPLTGGEVAEGNAVTMIYSVSRGAFHLVQNDFDPANIPVQQSSKYNFAISVAVNSPSANQMTISIKGLDGNDPSTLNPVYVPFRSATATSGIPAQLAITSALSFTVSSGSTLGTASGVISRIWFVLFNDGGTPKIGVVRPASANNDGVFPLLAGINSATAEGGGGGADSAQVIYASTSISNMPMTPIGYAELTQGTAGNWATSPTLVQVYSEGIPLPGTVIQIKRTTTGVSSTGTTTIPLDNTIPQNTEGNQYMTRSITPYAAPNLIRLHVKGLYAFTATGNAMIQAVFRDSGADAISASAVGVPASGPAILENDVIIQAGSVSPTTFAVRAGGSGAGTTTFNGQTSTQIFGGTSNSWIEADEIMA